VVGLRVGQNARLRFVGAQDMNERSYVFGAQRAGVARDGSLDWVVVGFGSGNGKVRTETLLAGEGSHAKVTGAYAPHARQHVDISEQLITLCRSGTQSRYQAVYQRVQWLRHRHCLPSMQAIVSCAVSIARTLRRALSAAE
jgi:Fe-S cluster assembly scaffold protein SufB